MAFHSFTSPRATAVDEDSLLAQLRSADASASLIVQNPTGPWIVGKATAWTAPQVATAQAMIDTAPAASARLTAQADIDRWPISVRALVLTLVDQINVLRAGLPTPLAPITPAQAVAAIRAKAGTL